MKLGFWDWAKADGIVVKNCNSRAKKAAEALAKAIRAKCPVGTVSYPMYKTGKYAGQKWTKHDAGQLKKSVRVVEKKEKYGWDITYLTSLGELIGGPRVYVGNYYAYYANIVEFYTPFIRKTAESMRSQMKNIMENG